MSIKSYLYRSLGVATFQKATMRSLAILQEQIDEQKSDIEALTIELDFAKSKLTEQQEYLAEFPHPSEIIQRLRTDADLEKIGGN